MPSVMPQRSSPTQASAFELQWSCAQDSSERELLSSVDRYRRMVVSSGGLVQRCDIDADADFRSGRQRLIRMAVHCDRATLASLQSEMLFDDAISLHLVRRIEAALHSEPPHLSARNDLAGALHAALAPRSETLNELIEKRISEKVRSHPSMMSTHTAVLRMIGARDVGLRLGNVSDQTVRIREREGKLFSLLRPKRLRGREYPEYQLEVGIHGRPLTSVLRILGQAGGEAVHRFFITRVSELGELTPLEVLRGVAFGDGPVDPLIGRSADQRLTAVLNAAEQFVLGNACPDPS
jgi:hypothetical protein